MNNRTTTDADELEQAAQRVWDRVSADALTRPKEMGHGIDSGSIKSRCLEEMRALTASRQVEIDALRADLDDLRAGQQPPSPTQPQRTPEDWQRRIAGMAPLHWADLQRIRAEASRRLSALGASANEVNLVRLVNALMGTMQDPNTLGEE